MLGLTARVSKSKNRPVDLASTFCLCLAVQVVTGSTLSAESKFAEQVVSRQDGEDSLLLNREGINYQHKVLTDVAHFNGRNSGQKNI